LNFLFEEERQDKLLVANLLITLHSRFAVDELSYIPIFRNESAANQTRAFLRETPSQLDFARAVTCSTSARWAAKAKAKAKHRHCILGMSLQKLP